MPDPQSRRGNVITEAGFENPFSTPIFPLGSGGIDLVSAIDKVAVGQFTRLTNAYFPPGESRYLTARLGETLLVSGMSGGNHSVVRLNNEETDSFTYVWGTGTRIYIGASGTPTLLDTGYSGDPLTFVTARPPLSGDPWVFIGDSDKMVKVRDDGLTIPIGLAAPVAACSASLATEDKTNIAVGTTTADTWTANGGYDFSTPPLPAAAGTTETDASGSTFTTAPGFDVLAAGNGYWCFWGAPKTLNLDVVGSRTASDEDLIHMALKFGNPALVAELRVYFVCAETFSESVLPGLGTDASGDPTDANTDYFVKSFRPDDFTPQVQSQEAQVIAAETARINELRQRALAAAATAKGFGPKLLQTVAKGLEEAAIRNDKKFIAQRDPTKDISIQGPGSGNQYIEFGTAGIPLRRGEWKRYGNTTGRDWNTITGIIIFLQAGPGLPSGSIFATLLNVWLTGGSGPDVSDPAAQSYDYRFTHYDPRTGAESNPSPVMSESAWMDPIRRGVTVAPASGISSAIRQRIYRRGGFLPDDWYYTGVNDSNGATFTDRETDLAIEAAGTVEIDHYQPVTTVNDAGDTVLAQPVAVLFGPYNGSLLALGDPFRPGYVYASLPNQPDHWPQDLIVEVCAASDELMNGVMYGNQAYVFSRHAGYAIYGNLTGEAGLSAAPSGCKHGLAGRWAIAVGAGAIWIISTDNGYRTAGGAEEPFLNALWPLFHGQSMNGYAPINFAAESALRLAVYDNEVWFAYLDTNAVRQVWVYNTLDRQTRHYDFGIKTWGIYADQGQLLLGGATNGGAYIHSGTADGAAGLPITVTVRTGAWAAGMDRNEKLWGDQILDMTGTNVALSWQNFLNAETVTNTIQSIAAFTGRRRVILDSFGTIPQIARSVSTEIIWSTTGAPPTLYFLGSSITAQPDMTCQRPTNWDDLGHPDEKYVMGVTLDCDTNGEDRTIFIERDFNGSISTIATLVVNSLHRHKLAFSWAALNAHQVRIHPSGDCAPWILYRADWNWQPEPPNIATWDTYFENAWDQYYTGLDLYVNTYGATKVVVVEVDGVALTNPATGDDWWEVTTVGRKVVHLTLPTGRGHVFRFYATDDNPGMLFSHEWHLVKEPTEQANWDAPYTILGTQADKYLKAIVFEVDTFGQNKSVAVEADGVVVDTLTVNANGRKVVQLALTDGQQLGRVWRIIPTDNFPSRLYSLRPVFDEEPFALMRFETQWIDHGEEGYHFMEKLMVTLKSTLDVTLSIAAMVNQATDLVRTVEYNIPTTAGVKAKRFVPVEAVNGFLYKYIFTCEASFYLYMEESFVTIQDWRGGAPRDVHPFGNTGADLPTRAMLSSTLAAARSGGGD